MATELHGKVALITGSSSGIGEAIAYRLARDGATVIVHGRNAERAERVAEVIRSEGGSASVVLGDLTDVAAANTVIATIFSEYPDGIDILFNNAGGDTAAGPNATWFDVSPEEWLGTYDFNVLPAVRMIHAFAPLMRKRGWGRIIQISSVVGHHPMATIPDYGAAKGALLNMTRSLAKELAHSGVTSNSISPGLIRSPSVEDWLRGLAKEAGWGDDWSSIEKNVVRDFVPNRIGRIGRPDDIAHAAAYLASPNSGFVTGVDMLVSGWQPD